MVQDFVTPQKDVVENITYDELFVGQAAKMVRTITADDIGAFAAISGDTNPAHLDPVYADATLFHGVIAHGMWGGAMISAVLGTVMPGPGTIYLEQSLRFSRPVRIGDTLVATVIVKSKNDEKKIVELDCVLTNQSGEKVISGLARVLAPLKKVKRARINAPHIQLFNPEARLDNLVSFAKLNSKDLKEINCAYVHPCHAGVIEGAILAKRNGLLNPVFVGPAEKILFIAKEADLDISDIEIVNTAHSDAAAALAIDMACQKRVSGIMCGSLRKEELIGRLANTPALATERCLSHVFRFDAPLYDKPLFLTDAVMNAQPSLSQKVDMVKNAVDLLRRLGVDLPRVGILSSVEEIDANVPSTIDAAAICKMLDSGQIRGALIDGPLAFDSAVSLEQASLKHPNSQVAGQADILLAPDLEAACLLGRQLQHLAGAAASGVLLGARVPVGVVTHRMDTAASYLAAAAMIVCCAV